MSSCDVAECGRRPTVRVSMGIRAETFDLGLKKTYGDVPREYERTQV